MLKYKFEIIERLYIFTIRSFICDINSQVIGNETFNFNFEFYDVNNKYIPVAVTESALFTGGKNNSTISFISESNKKLSSSVSYDQWYNPTGKKALRQVKKWLVVVYLV